MVDISVKSAASWTCPAQGCPLADVLLPVHATDEEELGQSQGDGATWCSPVLLEQTEDGCPCVLTLRSSCSSAISRLLVISEARTMELYDQAGDYCGTARGERDDSVLPHSGDRGPFYRKQLILELPSSACEVKLLSLAGRSSLLVCGVAVGLRPLPPCPLRGPGVDMQQVQSLVEEMGTSLSAGAQNLMEMIHFQQKNQTGSLGDVLPLLMGGAALPFLARGANATSLVGPGDAMSCSSASSSPDSPLSAAPTNSSASSESGGLAGHAHLAEMMSHFLEGDRGRGLNSELLPALQSVCGQVTQLRLEDEEKKRRNGAWELDSAMERRLEEMERRLKEHVDRRLDALERKLEEALNRGGVTRSAAGPPGPEPPEAPWSSSDQT